MKRKMSTKQNANTDKSETGEKKIEEPTKAAKKYYSNSNTTEEGLPLYTGGLIE